MKQKRALTYVWMSLFVTLFMIIAGCSGGGDSTPAYYTPAAAPDTTPAPVAAPETATGVFIDGPVSGLNYTSGNQSGITGADGTFTYEAGQKIRFYSGNVIIGEAIGKAVITPVDLAQDIDPAADASDPCVTNIVRFLMSISKISTTGRMVIDPTKVKGAASAADFNVSTASFTAILSGISSGFQYTEAQAKEHFKAGGAHYELTKQELDTNNDGTVDATLIPKHTYDANGYETKMETGPWVYNYTYDANGKLQREESNFGGNVVQYYTYNQNGNIMKIEMDNDNNGTIDLTLNYTYNVNGYKTKMESVDKDDNIICVNYYTYDANAKITKDEMDSNNDGTIDIVAHTTYDLNGNVIKNELDSNNDGTIDSVAYVTWQKI